MESFEKAKYVNLLLESLNKSESPIVLSEVLNKTLPFIESNQLEYNSITEFVRKYNLVKIADWNYDDNGKSNPKYTIADKGKELFENNDVLTFILAEDFKEMHPEIYDEKIWDEYLDNKLEKRVSQADFFFDVITSEKLLNIEKPEIRKYFKQWFKETQKFDLQIKNGDLAIEDGDLQIVPDFDESNIPEFVKWFDERKDNFLNYLKEHGIYAKQEMAKGKQIINNKGNLIINENSMVKDQSIESGKNEKESIWTKANVIIALIVGVFTIIGIIWGIFKGI
ncbi:hypothetical protein [Amniculibacterium sp. G2-70]|uniref:hypothetical protein n=1 Tax=Amniculibacterium sp. G2-70 TaxID=2767188 RepID=UPI0016545705|nr:hypothetical protein [Amniculibacterium sp. G2-70]MBS1548265.1 hypothetical protein [Bacteroidota bacterium]